MPKREIHTIWRAIAVGAIATLALAGCTGDGSSEGSVDPNIGAGATAPGGGDVTETVDPVDVATLDPVALTDTADVDGVAITIDSVESITLEAKTPGDVSGPALAVTVSVKNGTDKPIDVATAVVVLTQGDATAATPSSLDPASPLTGKVEPGKSTQGVYVFEVPADVVNPVTVTVNYAAGAAVAVFTGDVK